VLIVILLHLGIIWLAVMISSVHSFPPVPSILRIGNGLDTTSWLPTKVVPKEPVAIRIRWLEFIRFRESSKSMTDSVGTSVVPIHGMVDLKVGEELDI